MLSVECQLVFDFVCREDQAPQETFQRLLFVLLHFLPKFQEILCNQHLNTLIN